MPLDKGARIILIPELFEGPYFCKDQLPEHLARARPLDGHPTVAHFAAARGRARRRPSAEPLRAGRPGAVQLGRRRRRRRVDARHLSQEPHPRRAGLHREVLLLAGRHRIPGVAHEHTARSASASAGTSGSPSRRAAWRCSGAEVLLYPTAIGSEPPDPSWDSAGHWQRVMQGHAGANLMPIVAANRVGHEIGRTCEITFYGSSFIADATGERSPRPAATARRCSWRRSTASNWPRSGPLGVCSVIVDPTCTARSRRSTAER